MKNVFNTICGLFLIVLLAAARPASAQHTESDVKSLMAIDDWTFAGDSRYAYLKEGGSTSWWYRTFRSDREYAVVAFSEDGDVDDVDLEIQTGSGYAFKRDVLIDALPIVTFSVGYDRQLRIKMTNYSSSTPNYASKCYFMIFYR